MNNLISCAPSEIKLLKNGKRTSFYRNFLWFIYINSITCYLLLLDHYYYKVIMIVTPEKTKKRPVSQGHHEVETRKKRQDEPGHGGEDEGRLSRMPRDHFVVERPFTTEKHKVLVISC